MHMIRNYNINIKISSVFFMASFIANSIIPGEWIEHYIIFHSGSTKKYSYQTYKLPVITEPPKSHTFLVIRYWPHIASHKYTCPARPELIIRELVRNDRGCHEVNKIDFTKTFYHLHYYQVIWIILPQINQ